jgi:hypothetical protein
MPQHVESLLAEEPVLTDAFQLLQNDEVPEEVRRGVRQMIELVVQQARMAAGGWPSGPEPTTDVLAAD